MAAPNHPLARAGRPLTRDVLMEAEFLVADNGCTSKYLLDQYGRDLAPFTKIGMITGGSTMALMRIVANGRGITMVPRLVARRQLADGDLVERARTRTGRPPSLRLARVGIEARWLPRLGPAEQPMRDLLRLARRHCPLPASAPVKTDASVATSVATSAAARGRAAAA